MRAAATESLLMHVAVYSTRRYDREFLDRANAAGRHRMDYLEARLDLSTVPAAGIARVAAEARASRERRSVDMACVT